MSAFGGKADMPQGSCLLLRSLSDVKRTSLVAAHMSAFDPRRTLTTPILFNDLVRKRNQSRRNGQPQCSGGLQIDHKFVLGRLKNRQVGRLRTFKNLSDVGACVSVGICDTRSVADETTIKPAYSRN